MQLWTNVNPLCELYAATNIPDLVTAGTMSGWSCDADVANSNWCDGWTGVQCYSEAYPMNVTVQSLSLSNLGITGNVPSAISSAFYNLQSFDVSNNKLTGTGLESLLSMSNLQTVDFSNNMFSGSVPTKLGELALMSSLAINDNYLTGVVPSELCSDKSLTSLDFANEADIHCYASCLTSVTTLDAGSYHEC